MKNLKKSWQTNTQKSLGFHHKYCYWIGFLKIWISDTFGCLLKLENAVCSYLRYLSLKVDIVCQVFPDSVGSLFEEVSSQILHRSKQLGAISEENRDKGCIWTCGWDALNMQVCKFKHLRWRQRVTHGSHVVDTVKSIFTRVEFNLNLVVFETFWLCRLTSISL